MLNRRGLTLGFWKPGCKLHGISTSIKVHSKSHLSCSALVSPTGASVGCRSKRVQNDPCWNLTHLSEFNFRSNIIGIKRSVHTHSHVRLCGYTTSHQHKQHTPVTCRPNQRVSHRLCRGGRRSEGGAGVKTRQKWLVSPRENSRSTFNVSEGNNREPSTEIQQSSPSHAQSGTHGRSSSS